MRRMNHIFLRALKDLGQQDLSECDNNPIELLIPYARMALLKVVSDMEHGLFEATRDEVVLETEQRYVEQSEYLNQLRLNLASIRAFTSDSSSAAWLRLLTDYERALERSEQQIVRLTQITSSRAAWVSLREAMIHFQQNARMNKLTQLAFVFVPLSFATSLFGMSIKAFGSGSAQIWEFVAAIIVTYVSVAILWMILHCLRSVWGWLREKLERL